MKSSFHHCEDCHTPAACEQYAKTSQGMPCLPATNGGQPLPIDSAVHDDPGDLSDPVFPIARAVTVEVAKMSLLPGDILLVSIPGDVPISQFNNAAQRIKEAMEQVVPLGVRVVVKAKEIELGILEKATA